MHDSAAWAMHNAVTSFGEYACLAGALVDGWLCRGEESRLADSRIMSTPNEIV